MIKIQRNLKIKSNILTNNFFNNISFSDKKMKYNFYMVEFSFIAAAAAETSFARIIPKHQAFRSLTSVKGVIKSS